MERDLFSIMRVGFSPLFYNIMIVLRNKRFGFVGNFTGISNLGKALKPGTGLGLKNRAWEATKGVSKMGAIGLGTAAVGTGLAANTISNIGSNSY